MVASLILFNLVKATISIRYQPPRPMYLIYVFIFFLFTLQQNIGTSASDAKSADMCDTSASKSSQSMKDVYVQHTMHRIKDPKVSLPFYTDALGLTILDTATLMVTDAESKFTMWFLAYEDPDNIPFDDEERRMWAMSYPGAINLQYLWGENVSSHVYHDVNAIPTGYSHIGIFATDVYAFCDRLMEFNVTFIKKPNEGVALGNAFILDPDGYWIEIMNSYKMTTITE